MGRLGRWRFHVADGNQGLVGVVEREDGGAGADAEVGGDFEEVTGVGAGHIGDTANLALAPEAK